MYSTINGHILNHSILTVELSLKLTLLPFFHLYKLWKLHIVFKQLSYICDICSKDDIFVCTVPFGYVICWTCRTYSLLVETDASINQVSIRPDPNHFMTCSFMSMDQFSLIGTLPVDSEEKKWERPKFIMPSSIQVLITLKTTYPQYTSLGLQFELGLLLLQAALSVQMNVYAEWAKGTCTL